MALYLSNYLYCKRCYRIFRIFLAKNKKICFYNFYNKYCNLFKIKFLSDFYYLWKITLVYRKKWFWIELDVFLQIFVRWKSIKITMLQTLLWKLLSFFTVLISIEVVAPIRTTIAICLMISFTIHAFEDVRTWLTIFGY